MVAATVAYKISWGHDFDNQQSVYGKYYCSRISVSIYETDPHEPDNAVMPTINCSEYISIPSLNVTAMNEHYPL